MAVLAALGVVTSFLGPAMDIGKLNTAPIRRQCSYLCCLRSNIKTLEDEAKSLDDAMSDLQGKVDVAINNAQRINSQVETWLKDSVKAKTETKEILDEAPDVGSGCSKLGKRYSLSKKAKKATIAIKELVGKCNFTEISHPPPAAASAPVQSGTRTIEFDSRKQIETKIMESLEDEKNTKRICICGMGGLGKTTMARKIMNRALEKGFNEVVMAVVSQSVNEHNIHTTRILFNGGGSTTDCRHAKKRAICVRFYYGPETMCGGSPNFRTCVDGSTPRRRARRSFRELVFAPAALLSDLFLILVALSPPLSLLTFCFSIFTGLLLAASCSSPPVRRRLLTTAVACLAWKDEYYPTGMDV